MSACYIFPYKAFSCHQLPSTALGSISWRSTEDLYFRIPELITAQQNTSDHSDSSVRYSDLVCGREGSRRAMKLRHCARGPRECRIGLQPKKTTAFQWITILLHSALFPHFSEMHKNLNMSGPICLLSAYSDCFYDWKDFIYRTFG